MIDLAEHDGALVAALQVLILGLAAVHNAHDLWEVRGRLHRDGELGRRHVNVADLQEAPLVRHRAVSVCLEVDLRLPAAHH